VKKMITCFTEQKMSGREKTFCWSFNNPGSRIFENGSRLRGGRENDNGNVATLGGGMNHQDVHAPVVTGVRVVPVAGQDRTACC
jgi:hypothetical protein